VTRGSRADRPRPQRLATPARLAAALGGRLPAAGARVGLLGGSFNPAHGGHRAISLEALRRLRLDEVWWLVSPQNPLKAAEDMAPLPARLERARRCASHPRIRPTALEDVLGTRYSVDTLAALTARFPRVRFVFLIGADNLLQLPRWRRWQEIFHLVVIAVFDRPSYALKAWSGLASRRFARSWRSASGAGTLAGLRPPAWTLIRNRLYPQSATRIRAHRAEAADPCSPEPRRLEERSDRVQRAKETFDHITASEGPSGQ